MNSRLLALHYPNSNQALHAAHRDWIPDYSNPYNLILTFSEDVGEEHARNKYSLFIRKLSKYILKNGYTRFGNIIGQRSYLEYRIKGGYHIHTLCDVREDWDDCFVSMVHKVWRHGIVTEIAKVPVNELGRVQGYNSKMRTKKIESGYYSDSHLVVD